MPSGSWQQDGEVDVGDGMEMRDGDVGCRGWEDVGCKGRVWGAGAGQGMVQV